MTTKEGWSNVHEVVKCDKALTNKDGSHEV